MLSYTKSTKNYFGKGAVILNAHKDVEEKFLADIINDVIIKAEVKEVSQAIGDIYEQCKKAEFDKFMELWVEEFGKIDTVYLATIEDDYYGEFIITGFMTGIYDIEFFMWEVA